MNVAGDAGDAGDIFYPITLTVIYIVTYLYDTFRTALENITRITRITRKAPLLTFRERTRKTPATPGSPSVTGYGGGEHSFTQCATSHVKKGHPMDPGLIGYNLRRRQQVKTRRWQHQESLAIAYLARGTMAALARRLGVHRSTILRDVRACYREYWQRKGVTHVHNTQTADTRGPRGTPAGCAPANQGRV